MCLALDRMHHMRTILLKWAGTHLIRVDIQMQLNTLNGALKKQAIFILLYSLRLAVEMQIILSVQ